MSYDIEAIADDHYARMYDDYYGEEKEDDDDDDEYMTECNGEDCEEKIEKPELLCNECKRLLQQCFKNFLNNFNENEQEYIIDYILKEWGV